MLQTPQDPVAAIINQINAALPPTLNVFLTAADAAPATPAEGIIVLSRRPSEPTNGTPAEPDAAFFDKAVHLSTPADHDRPAAMNFLADLAANLAKVQLLHERHAALQRLAITDDLTGLANGRYFRQFLSKVVEKARIKRFLVTLFLFDIDNFKQYNDQYGHGGGDDILKQLANLMRHAFAIMIWSRRSAATNSRWCFGTRKARELRASLAPSPPIARRRNHRISLSVSGGCYPPRIFQAWGPAEKAA